MKDFPSTEQFLQKYYKELTPEEMTKVLKRIENEVERQYGMRPQVRDLKPMDGVDFADRALPSALALKPSTTKIALNPITNASACTSVLMRAAAAVSAWRSSTLSPVSNER